MSDRNILVVDDDAQVRAAIVRAVNALGYPAIEAGSGKEAIRLVREDVPALVILDYRMPGMNGVDTGRALAEIDPDLPILFSTGHAALRALRTEAGEDMRVLEKPFTLDELDILLGEHLAERRRVRSL